MTAPEAHYREVWFVDFEFQAPAGERPTPICMVARELSSGRTLRVWQDELRRMSRPPFNVSEESLFVAYYASAELGCFLALGWPMPARILDLFCEFRRHTNGIRTMAGAGLVGALVHFGLDSIDAADKREMRELAMRGSPYTDVERVGLLDYCESDVVALAKLWPRMAPTIDLPRALLRGRYMAAAARIEWCGVPIDTDTLGRLRDRWDDVKGELIGRVDSAYGVYEDGSFRASRFEALLSRRGIPWPRTETGKLSLDSDTFRERAVAYPELMPLKELRVTLGEMRLFDLAVGHDGRNRCLLSAFRARTGRNQPSNTKFIFGPSAWLRGLIKPEPGQAVAYIDWSQQEVGIAAALSGDAAMLEAYASGDPYLAFAKQAKAVPEDATKKSHKAERDLYKACVLAIQYGMGPESLAARIERPTATARHLLQQHRDTYPVFWRWSEGAVHHAMLRDELHTVFGWQINVEAGTNPRALANFPMQGNGAEMLRLACCLATERGIGVCAPVHDALLVEGPAGEIDQVVADTQAAMREASRSVLDGFELATDADVVGWPDRYSDPRGERLWGEVNSILRPVPVFTA
ncbi:MAG: DNA polymerase [Planctomycetota bacterium]